MSEQPQAPGGVLARRAPSTPFEVHLDVFSGPFELLLGLISKHQLDITEIALAKVTDEFVAHIRSAHEGPAEWDLDQATEFLLIAATLLDIKAARLVPGGGDQDEEDLALIEARDLLFARLLQYRAFKDVAALLADRMATSGRITARQAGLEERFAALLPELIMSISPEQLARIAARTMTPRPEPTIGLDHLHAPTVDVREQALIVSQLLRAGHRLSFTELVADADSTLVIVARFLALLELFKESAVAFEQTRALGPLDVCWTGADDVEITDEYDTDDHDTHEDVTDEPAKEAPSDAR